MKFSGILLVLCLLAPSVVQANTVARACLSSERGTGQRALCGCIQSAANVSLSKSDQRRAATFFGDPDLSQSVRQSDRKRDEAFWERYKHFNDVARKLCSTRRH